MFRKRATRTKRFDSQAVDTDSEQGSGNESGLIPRVYTRSEHNISRKQISSQALKVLYTLSNEGYEAYLVGGCVRDLLLGREPKDFDVATDASPEQIRAIFRNCRLIGRRFRLAHIIFGREIIEVATFRGASDNADSGKQKTDKEGRLLRDNHYGTISEDVIRRDFTVNALYYNIKDFSIVDFVGGMDDHKAGLLRLIGDPETRYREDPVRMIRLIRFAVKLGFKIEESCEKPVFELANLLANIPPARLHDETLKLFLSGYAVQTFESLRHYGLFQYLYPSAESALNYEENNFPHLFIAKALENTDKRLNSNQTVSPYFLISVFLWDAVDKFAKDKIGHGVPVSIAYQKAATAAISEQQQSTACTKMISFAMRDVWMLQSRFSQRNGNKAFRLLAHPRFRAGYDFFCLRAETGDADLEIATWWTTFQTLAEPEQQEMVKALQKPAGKKAKKRRRRKPKSKAVVSNDE